MKLIASYSKNAMLCKCWKNGRQAVEKRWSILLFCSFILVLMATAPLHAQRITYSGKNVAVEEVITAVEKQTGFVFVYEAGILKGAFPVDISATNVALPDFMSSAFKGQPFTWTIRSQTIVLKKIAPIQPVVNPGKDTASLGGVVSGVITDNDGKEMEGVGVGIFRNSGVNTGTLTDSRGRFQIKAMPGDEIQFIFMGFEPRHVKTNGKDFIRIRMERQSTKLAGVEVAINTGYQRILPQQMTGAVSQITTKRYESSINPDLLSGLQGRLTGVLINNDIKFTGGDGKTNNLFQIRGLSTISGNSSPLIVVDGYPTGLSLSDINPNEIKSVTVLKDAAAAAIYGVKASNGVVVVESKTATAGKPAINFRTTASYTPRENYSRYRWAPANTFLDYERYITGDGDSIPNTSLYLNSDGVFAPGVLPIYQKAAGLITDEQLQQALQQLGNYNNTKDYSRLLTRPATSQLYNLDISGGSPNALYYITAGFQNGNARQIRNNNQSFQLTIRTNLTLSKRLSLELINAYNQATTNSAPVPDINSIYPTDRLQDEYGNPAAIYTGGVTNYSIADLTALGLYDPNVYPLVDVKAVRNKNTRMDNRFTARLKYQMNSGIDFSIGGDYERSNTSIHNYASLNSSMVRQLIDAYARPDNNNVMTFNLPRGGYLQENQLNQMSYTVRAQFDYTHKFGTNHLLSAIAGAEINRTTNSSNGVPYFGYDDQTLTHQPVDWVLIQSGSLYNGGRYANPTTNLSYSSLFTQTYTDDRYVSGYANAAYVFKSKYTATGSVRVDQSNLFGTDPKYRYKPMWSFGAAWNISREGFMENVNWITNMKLRLADGITGNTAKMAIPQVIAVAGLNSNSISPSQPFFTLSSPANSGLRWESTNNFNAGLDWTIFKNVNGSIDYYNKKSVDVLGQSLIDATHGVSSALVNEASITNSGLEIKVDADWIKRGKTNWYTGFVLSKNVSKVLQVYNGRDKFPYAYQWAQNPMNYVAGYPVGAMFSYRFAGLDNTGAPLIYNSKGDKITPNLTDPPDGEIVYSGTQIPVYNVGISNRVDIGRFYFYCMLNYFGGFNVRIPGPNPNMPRPIAGSENFWKHPGDEMKTNVMNPNLGPSSSATAAAYNNPDIRVVKGNYITLNNVTLSYDFSNFRCFRRVRFNGFQLLVQGGNLYTHAFNKYNYSVATGSYTKSYVTPNYTIGLYTSF